MMQNIEEMNKSEHKFKEFKVEVDMRKSEEMLNRMIDELNKDSPDKIIQKLLNTPDLWLPRFDVVKRQVEEIYSGKISSMIPHIVYSPRHEKPIAVLKDKDIMKFKLGRHYSLWMAMQDTHLKGIHDAIIKTKVKAENFNKFFVREELNQHTSFILKAINHHFGGDYISSIHILAPRLEGVLRDCFKLAGLEVLHKNKDGSWEEKSISQLLDQTSGVTSLIQTDLIEYLRYFLVRTLGENKRNELAHALMEESKFNEVLSLRLILLLIVFYNPLN